MGTPTKQSGLATNRSTMDHSQLDPSVWLWLATMEHSLWLVLVVGPLSASGLRPGRPPWGVRPQGTTTLSNFFIKKHPIFILLTIMIKHRSLETRVRKNCKISNQGGMYSANLQLEAQGPMGNPTLRFQAFNQVLKDAIMN